MLLMHYRNAVVEENSSLTSDHQGSTEAVGQNASLSRAWVSGACYWPSIVQQDAQAF